MDPTTPRGRIPRRGSVVNMAELNLLGDNALDTNIEQWRTQLKKLLTKHCPSVEILPGYENQALGVLFKLSGNSLHHQATLCEHVPSDLGECWSIEPKNNILIHDPLHPTRSLHINTMVVFVAARSLRPPLKKTLTSGMGLALLTLVWGYVAYIVLF